MNERNQSGLVKPKPKHGDFAKKLFAMEDEVKEKSLAIFQGQEVNGHTLQTVDKELEANSPEFYRRITQVVGAFNNCINVRRKDFLVKIPKEWKLFYLGVLPIYVDYGWIVSDEELISQANILESYIFWIRRTKEKLKQEIKENAPTDYYDTYSDIREKYYEDLHPKIVVRPEALALCVYETYF